MRDEHHQELERREELIAPAQGRIEVASIKNPSIVEILETLQRNRWSLHVLEEGFEFLTLALSNPALVVHSESRALPRAEKLNSFFDETACMAVRVRVE